MFFFQLASPFTYSKFNAIICKFISFLEDEVNPDDAPPQLAIDHSGRLWYPFYEIFIYMMNRPSRMINVLPNNELPREEYTVAVEANDDVIGCGMEQLD